MTFLGWLSDPFKGLSDLQLEDYRSLWITWYWYLARKQLTLAEAIIYATERESSEHQSTQKGLLVDMFPEADIQKNTPPKNNIYPLLSPYKACPAPHLAPSCAPPVAPSTGGCLKPYGGFVKISFLIVVFQTPNDDDDDKSPFTSPIS